MIYSPGIENGGTLHVREDLCWGKYHQIDMLCMGALLAMLIFHEKHGDTPR